MSQNERKLRKSDLTFAHNHPRSVNHGERKFTKTQNVLSNYNFLVVYGLLKTNPDYTVLADKPIEGGIGKFKASDISVITRDNKRIEIFVQPGKISPFSDLEITMRNLTKQGIYTGIILSADSQIVSTPYFRHTLEKRKTKFRKITGNEKNIAELQHWIPAYVNNVEGKLFQAELSPVYVNVIPIYDLDTAIQMHVDRDERLRKFWNGNEMLEETINVTYTKSPYQIKRGGITSWKEREEVTEEVNIELGKGKIKKELVDYKNAKKVYVSHPNYIFREVKGYNIAILEPRLHREQRLETEKPIQVSMNL